MCKARDSQSSADSALTVRCVANERPACPNGYDLITRPFRGCRRMGPLCPEDRPIGPLKRRRCLARIGGRYAAKLGAGDEAAATLSPAAEISFAQNPPFSRPRPRDGVPDSSSQSSPPRGAEISRAPPGRGEPSRRRGNPRIASGVVGDAGAGEHGCWLIAFTVVHSSQSGHLDLDQLLPLAAGRDVRVEAVHSMIPRRSAEATACGPLSAPSSL
jgi:hypothetical protein